jgi:hypothetical protein
MLFVEAGDFENVASNTRFDPSPAPSEPTWDRARNPL